MVETFKEWESDKQTNFVKGLLGEMCHEQHWQIDMALRPYLMRDFISALPEYVSEQILSYLDELSLCRAESVSKRWREIICNGEHYQLFVLNFSRCCTELYSTDNFSRCYTKLYRTENF